MIGERACTLTVSGVRVVRPSWDTGRYDASGATNNLTPNTQNRMRGPEGLDGCWSFCGPHEGCACVAFGDGAGCFPSEDIDFATFRGLAAIAGSEDGLVDHEDN